MAEGTCSFCGEWSRNACEDDREAADCGNISSYSRGTILSYTLKPEDVADYLDHRAGDLSEEEAEALRRAAEIVRNRP